MILNFKEVREKTGISRATAWRLEKEGKFPSRVAIGARRVGWFSDEVEAWCKALPRVRLAQRGGIK